MASPVHVVIPTHTPRYLPLVLAGLARQTRPADTIVVTCDTDDHAIGAAIEEWSARLALRVHWLRRAHHGVERLCQIRNNAARYLARDLGVAGGRLVVLDGDMIASDQCLALHESLGAAAPLLYPYRIDVPQDVSASLEPISYAARLHTLFPTDQDRAALDARHRRYERQLLLRRLRLGPLHKPKLLGGHFSVDLAWYLRLNGFDELYQGWGFKDDEFARRAARLGARVRVAVRDIHAYHLWHQTRQPPGRMADLPTAQRFSRRDLPDVCEHGVENPLPQHELRATAFGAGR